jgi:glycosyltransferase involved in cell wall biosynthesis
VKPYPSISVIISCFNEEENIEQCVRSVAMAMPESEILVVHGGTDRTAEIANSLKPETPAIRVVRNENDRGKGHAIRKGIDAATHDIMVQFDADNQFFATDLPALVDPILAGRADVTLGSRFLPSADRSAYKPSFFRDYGNRTLSAYVGLLCGKKVTDVTAGVKAWTRKAIQAIDLTDDKYSYEAEIVVRAFSLGLRVEDIPVKYSSRAAGESMHTSTSKVIVAGLTIMKNCLSYRFR